MSAKPVVVIVRFDLPAEMSAGEAAQLFEASVPRYQGVDGLIRKYYLLDQDRSGGGCYLWESREKAEAFYGDEWRSGIEARFGNSPVLTYFDAPVIVDNS